MKRTSLIISILLFITVFNFGRAVSGQTTPTDSDQYSAPIVWTEYRIPSQKLSITFPKLPVFTNASNLCSQIEGGLYVAYAGGAVYEFEWHTKSHAAIPDLCSVKTKFSKTTFTDRISELKAQVFGYVESEGAIAGIPATVLRSTSATGSVVRSRWLIWNKDRWLEFGITRRKETVIDEVRFLSGLKLSSSTGQDVK